MRSQLQHGLHSRQPLSAENRLALVHSITMQRQHCLLVLQAHLAHSQAVHCQTWLLRVRLRRSIVPWCCRLRCCMWTDLCCAGFHRGGRAFKGWGGTGVCAAVVAAASAQPAAGVCVAGAGADAQPADLALAAHGYLLLTIHGRRDCHLHKQLAPWQSIAWSAPCARVHGARRGHKAHVLAEEAMEWVGRRHPAPSMLICLRSSGRCC
mmetsp:Transcript_10847/g.29794  ORF Transcript_10847/g.29794 Transcript_10847/m.29794 type:complete len:208 (+) Transcript_10847:998-1621(+)